MKTLYFFALLLVIATSTFAQGKKVSFQEEEYRLKGSEKPIYKNGDFDSSRCVVYKNYVVKAVAGGEAGGETVNVYRQTEKVPSKKSCSKYGDLIVNIKNSSGLKDGYDGQDITNMFYGIYDKLLFIDKAVEPFQGAFEIFELTAGKSVYQANNYSDLKILPNGILFYENWAVKDGLEKNCKEARQIKKRGLAVGWIDKFDLNLKTLKVKNAGLRCEPVQ